MKLYWFNILLISFTVGLISMFNGIETPPYYWALGLITGVACAYSFAVRKGVVEIVDSHDPSPN